MCFSDNKKYHGRIRFYNGRQSIQSRLNSLPGTKQTESGKNSPTRKLIKVFQFVLIPERYQMSAMRNHHDFIFISMIISQQDTPGVLCHHYQLRTGRHHSAYCSVHCQSWLRKYSMKNKYHRLTELFQHLQKGFFLLRIQTELMLHKYYFHFGILIQLSGQSSKFRNIRSIENIFHIFRIGMFFRIGLYCTYLDGVRFSEL